MMERMGQEWAKLFPLAPPPLQTHSPSSTVHVLFFFFFALCPKCYNSVASLDFVTTIFFILEARARACVCVCVYVRLRVRERERECVCVCVCM